MADFRLTADLCSLPLLPFHFPLSPFTFFLAPFTLPPALCALALIPSSPLLVGRRLWRSRSLGLPFAPSAYPLRLSVKLFSAASLSAFTLHPSPLPFRLLSSPLSGSSFPLSQPAGYIISPQLHWRGRVTSARRFAQYASGRAEDSRCLLSTRSMSGNVSWPSRAQAPRRHHG
jgi:hypothetical protein